MAAVFEPGKKHRSRFAVALDLFADGIGYLIAGAIIIGAAAYPLILAIQSGHWWLILLALVIVGGGAAALFAARD